MKAKTKNRFHKKFSQTSQFAKKNCFHDVNFATRPKDVTRGSENNGPQVLQ